MVSFEPLVPVLVICLMSKDSEKAVASVTTCHGAPDPRLVSTAHTGTPSNSGHGQSCIEYKHHAVST